MVDIDRIHDQLAKEIRDMLKKRYPTYNTLPPDMRELLYQITHDLILLIMDMKETRDLVEKIDKNTTRMIMLLRDAPGED